MTNYNLTSGRLFPRWYLNRALDLLGGAPPPRIIVELGSLRHRLQHDLDVDTQEECCLYGHSTLRWARSGHHIFSVDVDTFASDLTREVCAGHDNVTVVTCDGIEFLKAFTGEIDLLYLDAWDVKPGTDFAEKHLEAFEAARSKLSSRHMILIDDTDIETGGKGRLLVPRLIELGYAQVANGRQTLLICPAMKADRLLMHVETEGFWSNKRVMVTGGAGFFGSHVVEILEARNARVFVPRSREYDLTSREACRRAIADSHPDVVFHLAAKVGGIGANRLQPGTFLFENALMGLQMLEECRLAGVGKTIVAGTICAYPKFAPVPFSEDDLWNGYPEETNAPYGIAKKLLLVQSSAYRDQYDMNSIVLFPVNMYGPRDNFDLQTSHVIPAMIRKFVEAKDEGASEVVLWGDGSPTREFIYAEDAADGMILAAERYDSSDPVNLGSGEEISIRDLARVVAETIGYTGAVVWDSSKPNGQPRRRLDVSRAKERFGFVAKIPFVEGLARTVAWYLENR